MQSQPAYLQITVNRAGPFQRLGRATQQIRVSVREARRSSVVASLGHVGLACSKQPTHTHGDHHHSSRAPRGEVTRSRPLLSNRQSLQTLDVTLHEITYI